MLCREEEHYYVPASGDAKAKCTKCGATFWTTFGIAAVAGAIILIPKKRLAKSFFRRLGKRTQKRVLRTKLALYNAHLLLRLDNKLKILIGFYMIATKAPVIFEQHM